MPDATTSVEMHEMAFEAFGVRVGFRTNDAQVLSRLSDFRPPGSKPCQVSEVQQLFEVTAEDDGRNFKLQMNEEWVVDYEDLELALGLIDTHMCGFIAVNASERIFVHAGAVAYKGKMIVIPGMSFSGKSTLTAALVRAGATYYSDDFALLDEEGRVHPYPKPLSLRGERLQQTTHTAESLGGTTGDEPLAPSLIVITAYRPGAELRPSRLSPGEAVLGLLGNTVPARERPAESMRAIKNALRGAVVLEGKRGEADETVPLLLAELDR